MADLESLMARIATLVDELERSPESPARERARALMQAVLDVHHAGLARILEIAAARSLAAKRPGRCMSSSRTQRSPRQGRCSMRTDSIPRRCYP